jgi:hypothetical protein
MVSRLDVRSKVSQQTYGPEPRHTVPSVKENFIFTSHLITHVFLFRVVLVKIELMIGLFSVSEVMEYQGNYMEELYDPIE